MDKSREKYLTEKYLAGKTTLEEEHELKEAGVSSDDALGSWLNYAAMESIKTPENLSQSLWEDSPLQHKPKSRIPYILVASLLTIGILSYGLSRNYTKQSTADIKQKLAEAIEMVEESSTMESTVREVFYSDELITIYQSN